MFPGEKFPYKRTVDDVQLLSANGSADLIWRKGDYENN